MSKTLTTPKGKALYPKINEADTKFDANGKFSCDIIVDADAGAEFKALCEELLEEYYSKVCADAKKQGKKKPKLGVSSPVEVHDEDDGTYIIKCRRPAKVVSKKTGKTYEFSIKQFDAKGAPCKVDVGSGSVVKCAVEPNFYDSPALGVGMSLRLQAVQVLELVEFRGSEKAESFGFAEEDGSFTSDSEDLRDAFTEDESNGDF